MVGTNKSTPVGIIITALEVIEACFLDRVIAIMPDLPLAGIAECYPRGSWYLRIRV